MFKNSDDMARSSLAGTNHAGETGTSIGSFSESIISAAAEAGIREAGLPGRVDTDTGTCPKCGRTHLPYRDESSLCTECLEAQARSEERQDSLVRTLRQHRVHHVEDLPSAALRAHQDQWGCD